MYPEAIIALVAGRQHGVATTRQLLDAGITKAQISYRHRGGLLVPMYRGVWRVAGHSKAPEQGIAAAVLAAGEGAMAAQRSAARLWSLELDRLDEIDVVVPAHRRPVVPGVHVHRTADLVDLEASRRQGIACTNPLRMLVDLGAVAPASVAEALEQLLVRRLVTVRAVRAALDRHARPGHNGCGVLRGVLEDRALGDKPPDSVLEPAMAALLRRHRVRPMTFQHPVAIGSRRFVLDFAYPELRIAVEVDGNEKHGRLDAMINDRRRDALLASAGWVVLRFMWLQVKREPAWVAARITEVRLRRAS